MTRGSTKKLNALHKKWFLTRAFRFRNAGKVPKASKRLKPMAIPKGRFFMSVSAEPIRPVNCRTNKPTTLTVEAIREIAKIITKYFMKLVLIAKLFNVSSAFYLTFYYL